ncbi:MAG: hypothetical protein OXI80_21250 [Caldilineaceae bacterium]|nr:hypothetical protein [Caldilineaceae bacterium]
MDYNGSVMKRVALFLIVAGAAVAMVACQGAVGKTGEPGEPGAQGPPGEADNKAPFANIPFKTVILMDGGKVETVDAADHFHDPEKEALSFRATVTMGEGIVTVTREGSVFTITPQAAGNAEITVTATDPKGKSGSAKINVMVTSERIMYDESLPRRIALVPGGVRTISGADIEGAFEEDEGETPEISVSSSDDTIVTAVKGDDNSVTITALDPADREATVTITATADDGESAEAMITVAVVASLAPQAGDPIPNPEPLTAGGEAATVNAPDYFSDPAGGHLTYKAMSSDDSIATAKAVDGVVTIMPIAAGTAMVTVTATNSDGEAASQTFTVTVNAAPVVVPAVTWKKEIPDVTFEHDGAPKMFMLAYYFNDATMYDTDHGDGTVVTAEVNDEQTMLTLTRVGPGTATVEVTPSNSVGDGVAQSITVTVEDAPAVPRGPALKDDDKRFDDFSLVSLAADTDSTSAADLAKGTKTWDLTEYIHDPDGFRPETLTFSTVTDMPEIVVAYKPPEDQTATAPTADQLKQSKVDGKSVTVRALKVGSADITVYATDVSGAKMSWTFTVTVVGIDNTVPTAATVTFPGDDSEGNPYRSFVGLNGAGRFKSTDTAPKSLKIDLGTLFQDTDIQGTSAQRANGDSWMFEAVSSDKKVVTVEVRRTGNSAKPDEHNVVITPVRPGTATIHFKVTDSFGATADTSASATFSVRVNHRPKDEGAEASNPGTLAKLSEKYEDLSQKGAFGDVRETDGTDVTDAHEVSIVSAGAGYFSDEDGDTLTCRFNTRGVDIFPDVTGDSPVDYPVWDTTDALQLNLSAAEGTDFKMQGTAHVDVWCNDGFEDSPTATLTVEVTSEGSIH